MIVLNHGGYGGSFYIVSKGVVEILAPRESKSVEGEGEGEGKYEGEYVKPHFLLK